MPMENRLKTKYRTGECSKFMEILIKSTEQTHILSSGSKNMLLWSVHRLQVEDLIFLTSIILFSSMCLLLSLTMEIELEDQQDSTVLEYLFSCFTIKNQTMLKK